MPAGDAIFHRQTTVCPELPAPGTADLVGHILAGHAYHLNVMPLDIHMPDAGALVRGIDIAAALGTENHAPPLGHRHRRRTYPSHRHRGDARPGRARAGIPDRHRRRLVVFSGDTSMNENLIALARNADILVHQVADLRYLRRHGMDSAELAGMATLHTDVTQVGSAAERAGVRELILSHYLPAEPDAITDAQWTHRARKGFSGTTTAGHDGLRRTLPATRKMNMKLDVTVPRLRQPGRA